MPPRSKSSLSTPSSVPHTDSQVVIPRFPGYFLLFSLALVCIALYFLFQPFLTILLLAAILATTFYPVYEKILKFFRNRARSASLVTCLLIIFLIVIPLFLFVLLLTRQAVDMYAFIQQKVQSGELDQFFH